MTRILLAAIVITLDLIDIWIVFGPWYSTDPGAIFIVLILFISPNIGTLWMIYVAAKSEKKPLAYMLLAFIPFFFIFYYFDRYLGYRRRELMRVAERQ